MTRQRSTQQLPIRCQRRQRTRGLRWDETILLVLGGALWLVVTPASAHAEGCGPRDLAACVNAAQYAFWHGVAGELWSVNRVFLTLAYQLDVFRAWLIETVFTSVFATVKDVISPALAPMATLAVLVGVLCFLLMPLIGRVEVVNIRRALIWIVVAPLLLGIAGQGLAGAEQFRTTLGQTLFAAAQAIGSVPRLGATSGEMNSVTTPLYPFSGCGGGALERPFTEGGSADGIFMDDLAASMMYADAEDIHCPLEGSGPGTELPDGFYSPAEGGPGGGGGDYATTQSVSDMHSAQSAEWVRKMQRGVTRLLMGVIPSLLAVMNAIIQLLFALALVLLFIALPLGLLLVFFTDTAAGVTGLARRMVSVLQTSWSSSLLLGILFVALLAASALGNVAAFVGLSVAGVLLTLFIIFIAVNAFMSSVQAVAQTVSLGSGIGAGAAKVALAGVTGGAGAVALSAVQASTKAGEMGLTYAVARRAGTSRRYALSTAAGRVGGVARVGELASALGMDNEVTDGIYTGRRGARSREGYRLTRRLAETDAGKPDGVTGLTMKEREEQRDLQWAAERARRGSQLEQAGRILSGTARAVRHPAQAALSGAQAVSPAIERIRALSGDTAHAAWERVRAAQDSVTERIGNAPAVISVATALAGAASHGFARDTRSGRVARNGRGGLRYLPRLVDPQIPSWSLRELVSDVKEGRLLQLGHHLQYNDDGSVTFWHPDGPALPKDVGATTPTPRRNDAERRDARRSGATSGQQRTVDIADLSAGMTTAANGHPPRDSMPAVTAPMPPTVAVIPGGFLPTTSSTAYPAPSRPGAPEAADSVLLDANASPLAPVMRPARRSRVYSVATGAPALEASQASAPSALSGAVPVAGDRVAVTAYTRARPQPRSVFAVGAEIPAPVQTGPVLDPAAYPIGAAPLTARAWHKSRRRARLELERIERVQRATTEHLRARTRLALVQQGAVVGPEAIAQLAVMDAEQRVTDTRERSSTALRPPLRRGIPRFINASRNAAGHQQRLRRGGHWNYKPGMGVPAGVSSPAPAMAREVARRNEALAINPEGYAVAVPLPNNAVPPRELRLDVPADEVLDFDELLRRGFQVYQSPQNDTVAVWPALDTPDVHWIDPGTPQARPDLVRVRRQLEQRGVLKRQQSSYQSRQQRVSRVSRTRSVAGRNNSRSARRTTREEQR